MNRIFSAAVLSASVYAAEHRRANKGHNNTQRLQAGGSTPLFGGFTTDIDSDMALDFVYGLEERYEDSVN
jgi:hypothetical protein